MNKELEIRKSLEPTVEKHLKLPSWKNRKWNPSQFFNFMEEEEYQTHLSILRKQSKNLPDSILVVVAGSTITEEALPNYAARGGALGNDLTGVSNNPWDKFYRWWNSEENQHGDALHLYLLLSGRVNMEAIDYSTQQLIRNGFSQSANMYNAIFYPMVQEPIARTGHLNTAKIAKRYGDSILEELSQKIGADEHRHSLFYRDVGKKLFDIAPEESIINFTNLMKRGIAMPSKLMENSDFTFPNLYNNFTNVAISTGMFTPINYADILQGLIKDLGIEYLNLKDKADNARNQLLRIPKFMRRKGESRKKEMYVPNNFDWIYDRKA